MADTREVVGVIVYDNLMICEAYMNLQYIANCF